MVDFADLMASSQMVDPLRGRQKVCEVKPFGLCAAARTGI
jgi:hypothetical protein